MIMFKYQHFKCICLSVFRIFKSYPTLQELSQKNNASFNTSVRPREPKVLATQKSIDGYEFNFQDFPYN